MARTQGTQVELPLNKEKVVWGQIVKGLKCYAEEFGPLTLGTGQVTEEEVGWYEMIRDGEDCGRRNHTPFRWKGVQILLFFFF